MLREFCNSISFQFSPRISHILPSINRLLRAVYPSPFDLLSFAIRNNQSSVRHTNAKCRHAPIAIAHCFRIATAATSGPIWAQPKRKEKYSNAAAVLASELRRIGKYPTQTRINLGWAMRLRSRRVVSREFLRRNRCWERRTQNGHNLRLEPVRARK